MEHRRESQDQKPWIFLLVDSIYFVVDCLAASKMSATDMVKFYLAQIGFLE